MTKLPATGGSFIRDPATGELFRQSDVADPVAPAEPLPAEAEPIPEPPPAPAKPKSKGGK